MQHLHATYTTLQASVEAYTLRHLLRHLLFSSSSSYLAGYESDKEGYCPEYFILNQCYGAMK